MINWPKLLDQNRIQYWQGSGANIETVCCFCGSSDQGHHLSISLEGNGYRCWRNSDHRGRNPVRLLMTLLNISRNEAAAIAGVQNHESVADNSFADYINGALRSTGNVTPLLHHTLTLPADYKLITETGGSRIAFHYLRSRGYDRTEAGDIIETYHLVHTIMGSYRYRIIFPIIMDSGLVNWTGRALSDNASLRYKTLTTDVEKSEKYGDPPAVLSVERTLWQYHDVATNPAKTLVICEGPFDAMRVDYYGRDYDVRATCVFGKQISDYQVNLLETLRERYDDIVLVIDKDAQLESLKLTARLSHLDVRFMYLPKAIKDPALLSRNQMKVLFG